MHHKSHRLMSIDALLLPALPPRLLEVHEVAFYLKCSQETVRRLIRERKLAAIRVGTQWRVRPADLLAYEDEYRQERVTDPRREYREPLHLQARSEGA